MTQHFGGGLRQLILSPAMLQWLTTEGVGSEEAERMARAQALRRDQAELERAQARLDVMYEDRLDGRIDADTYDRRAKEAQEQQLRIQQRMRSAASISLPAMSQAVDLMVRTSKAARDFPKYLGPEQHSLLQVVLKEATWIGGELRMLFREPFEKLRLSNSASTTDYKRLGTNGPDLITGGERGIRTLEVAIGSASCRFFVARSAENATAAVVRCTLLHGNSTWQNDKLVVSSPYRR